MLILFKDVYNCLYQICKFKSKVFFVQNMHCFSVNCKVLTVS
ncbi:hypothetical protein HMPREF0971_00620 [Segatella oris F0302]|uniref:Uncharacterized protein n=1 Tax=Segatella oris F0302 TaxID=649760 RepID=D1QNL2_9BACT|nr:hypothetical protein HMPREF0971_00620 [Segatella oris F0302]